MQTHINPARSLIGAIDVPGTEEDVDLYGDEPLEPLTEEEQADMDAWRAASLRDADKEAADFRRGLRENIIAEYGTPENYYHEIGCAGDEDEIARIFNMSKTFMEPRNIRRREAGRAISFQRSTKAHRMLVAMAPREAVITPTVAPLCPKEKVSEPKKPAVKRDAREVVRTFYAEAIAQHPEKAKKLGNSLEYQLGEYETTVAHFIEKGKSESEAVAIWENRARMAMEAKIK